MRQADVRAVQRARYLDKPLVLDSWTVHDLWWTDTPVRREFREVLLPSGERQVQMREGAERVWIWIVRNDLADPGHRPELGG